MNDKPKETNLQDLKGKQFAQSFIHKVKTTPDKQRRLELLKGLAADKLPWIREVLLAALDDPCEEVGSFIVQELGNWENLNFSPLYQRLSRSPWYVKIRILMILGMRKNPHSIPHIEGLISEPNVEVRRTIALVLAQIGGKEARALLVRLTKDESPFVRKAAEKALRETIDLKFT